MPSRRDDIIVVSCRDDIVVVVEPPRQKGPEACLATAAASREATKTEP